MKPPLCAAVLVLNLVAAGGPASAQDRPLAVRGGELHTVAQGVIANGTVVVRDGKIAAVGRDITVPQDARVIDARGLIVTPGIIDARARFGLRFRDAWDASRLVAAERRVVDRFDPWPEPEWLRDGVTTVYVAPSQRNLVGGFGMVVKLHGRGREAIVRDAAALQAGFGEAVLQSFETRTTRQGLLGILRQQLIRAREYAHRGEQGTRPDSVLEALAMALGGDVRVRVVTHTPDDIMAIVRLAEEFDLRLVLDQASGAHMVADALAARKIPVVVGPAMMALGSGGPFEMFAHTPESAAQLHRAGVTIALSTDGSAGRSVVVEGIVAKAHGLPEDAALRALTLDAAEILGVADRLGSIEVGKDADLVLWRGAPLGTWGETRVVLVDGRVVFER